MLTLEPKTTRELDEEPRFLEFDLPAETDLTDGVVITNERERYDDQIIAALVCP
jgi:hypothetical protein